MKRTILTLLATLFGMVMTNINHLLTGFVVKSGSSVLLVGTALFMLCDKLIGVTTIGFKPKKSI